MNLFSDDPTGRDDDYTTLTKDEENAIYMAAAVFAIVIVVVFTIVFALSWN